MQVEIQTGHQFCLVHRFTLLVLRNIQKAAAEISSNISQGTVLKLRKLGEWIFLFYIYLRQPF